LFFSYNTCQLKNEKRTKNFDVNMPGLPTNNDIYTLGQTLSTTSFAANSTEYRENLAGALNPRLSKLFEFVTWLDTAVKVLEATEKITTAEEEELSGIRSALGQARKILSMFRILSEEVSADDGSADTQDLSEALLKALTSEDVIRAIELAVEKTELARNHFSQELIERAKQTIADICRSLPFSNDGEVSNTHGVRVANPDVLRQVLPIMAQSLIRDRLVRQVDDKEAPEAAQSGMAVMTKLMVAAAVDLTRKSGSNFTRTRSFERGDNTAREWLELVLRMEGVSDFNFDRMLDRSVVAGALVGALTSDVSNGSEENSPSITTIEEVLGVLNDKYFSSAEETLDYFSNNLAEVRSYLSEAKRNELDTAMLEVGGYAWSEGNNTYIKDKDLKLRKPIVPELVKEEVAVDSFQMDEIKREPEPPQPITILEKSKSIREAAPIALSRIIFEDEFTASDKLEVFISQIENISQEEITADVKDCIRERCSGLFSYFAELHSSPLFRKLLPFYREVLSILNENPGQDKLSALTKEKLFTAIKTKFEDDGFLIDASELQRLYFLSYMPASFRYAVKGLIWNKGLIHALKSEDSKTDSVSDRVNKSIIDYIRAHFYTSRHFTYLYGKSSDLRKDKGAFLIEKAGAVDSIANLIEDDSTSFEANRTLSRFNGLQEAVYKGIEKLHDKYGFYPFQTVDIGHGFNADIHLINSSLQSYERRGQVSRSSIVKNGEGAIVLDDFEDMLGAIATIVNNHTAYSIDPNHLCETADEFNTAIVEKDFGLYVLDVELTYNDKEGGGIKCAENLLTLIKDRSLTGKNIIVWSSNTESVKKAVESLTKISKRLFYGENAISISESGEGVIITSENIGLRLHIKSKDFKLLED
jgi:hypothetical protein